MSPAMNTDNDSDEFNSISSLIEVVEKQEEEPEEPVFVDETLSKRRYVLYMMPIYIILSSHIGHDSSSDRAIETANKSRQPADYLYPFEAQVKPCSRVAKKGYLRRKYYYFVPAQLHRDDKGAFVADTKVDILPRGGMQPGWVLMCILSIPLHPLCCSWICGGEGMATDAWWRPTGRLRLTSNKQY